MYGIAHSQSDSIIHIRPQVTAIVTNMNTCVSNTCGESAIQHARVVGSLFLKKHISDKRHQNKKLQVHETLMSTLMDINNIFCC